MKSDKKNLILLSLMILTIISFAIAISLPLFKNDNDISISMPKKQETSIIHKTITEEISISDIPSRIITIIPDKLNIYDTMRTDISELKTETVIDQILSIEEINKIIEAIYLKDPEIFWLKNDFGCDFTENQTVINYEFKYTIGDIKQMKKDIDLFIEHFTSITEHMDNEQKIKKIHDMLIENTDYDYDADDMDDPAHTAYGCLINNKAVCDGFAKTFKLLCEKSNIDAEIILGADKMSDNISHAWNYVYLNDNYYWIDTTWDEIRSDHSVSYAYFMISDDILYKDHKIINDPNTDIFIPKCEKSLNKM